MQKVRCFLAILAVSATVGCATATADDEPPAVSVATSSEPNAFWSNPLLPDLVPEILPDSETCEGNPSVGVGGVMRFRIHNRGKTAAPASTATIHVNRWWAGEWQIPPIPAGQSSYSNKVTHYGEHPDSWSVDIDWRHAVSESNNDNNSTTYSCYPVTREQ